MPHDDVTRAVLALAPWLESTGRPRLLLELVEAAVDGATGADRAALRLWISTARSMLGDMEAAGVEARSALAIARRHRDRRLEARALAAVGMHHREAGKTRSAVTHLERALRLARAVRDRELEAETANRLALARWDLGDRNAPRLMETARTLARRARLHRIEGRVLGNLAAMQLAAGDDAGFMRHTTAAVAIFRRLKNRRHEGYGCFNLASFLSARGDLGEARQHYLDALAAAEATQDRKLSGIVVGHLGLLEQRQHGPAAGGEQLERAVGLLAGTDVWQVEAFITASLAAERAARGRVEEAAALLDRAERALAGRTPERVLQLFGVHRGHVELAQARRAEAGGDPTGAQRLRDAARARLAAAAALPAAVPPGEHAVALVLDPADLEFGARLLQQAFEQETPGAALPVAPGEPPPDHALVVDPTGAWFRPPGGAMVDLSRRRPLARIVAALAGRRREAGGAPLSLGDVVASGWPGERILREAAQDRVHVAIATLRKLGLRGVLLHGKAGYFLDRGVPLVDGDRVTSVVGRAS